MKTVYTIGFSTCPNDTFIFDALINNKIDTKGLKFEPILADIEELNNKACSEELDITKLSYYSYFHLTEKYVLLESGGAMGTNCGPLLISKKKYTEKDIPSLLIAIPGKYTTANFLLSLHSPLATKKHEILFSDIENAILQNKFDAGLIIHESRFTYLQKGLFKIIDLGEFWEQITKMPVPLGAIAIKRMIPLNIQKTINQLIRESVFFALSNPQSGYNYVKKYAQELDDKVIHNHISLYVNDFTENLGTQGKKAVKIMYDKAKETELITGNHNQSLFFSEA